MLICCSTSAGPAEWPSSPGTCGSVSSVSDLLLSFTGSASATAFTTSASASAFGIADSATSAVDGTGPSIPFSFNGSGDESELVAAVSGSACASGFTLPFGSATLLAMLTAGVGAGDADLAGGGGGTGLRAAARRGTGGGAGDPVRVGGLESWAVLGGGGGSWRTTTSSTIRTSFCVGATSAGFDSGGISGRAVAGGSSDAICALSVSSGSGAVGVKGLVCEDSSCGGGTEDSGDMASIVAEVSSSEGVTKPSSKVSVVSSVEEETRRLDSVGEDSGFTETEVGDCESPDEDTVSDDGRCPTPFSSKAGVRGRDRFRLGRGGGASVDGCGEAVRSWGGGATKRRFSGSCSPFLSLSLSDQPGTRSRPKDDATPQKPLDFAFLRGGTGGLSIVALTTALRVGGAGGGWTSSSQIFSKILVRRKDHRVQVARSRVRHHPEVHSGSAEGNAGAGSESLKIYICAGRDDASWYGGGDGGAEGDDGTEDLLKIDDDQVLKGVLLARERYPVRVGVSCSVRGTMQWPHNPQDSKLDPFDPWRTLTARGGWGEVAEAKIICVAIGSIVNCPLCIAAMIERLESQLSAEAMSRRTVGSLRKHKRSVGQP